MVVKVFISGISASKEVKKHQLRAQFLLDTYKIKYELVDVTDPLCEVQREFMLRTAKKRSETVPPQPPQFYNEDEYCGDYEDLENANDNDQLLQFLKIEEDITIENGNGDENDLFQPEQTNKNKGSASGDGDDDDEKKPNSENGKEDEEVKTEVREQITINGVVYDIPPDRKIMIGGRLINVDELMADEGDEIDLDQVDDKLKKGFISENKKDEEENEEEEEDDE